MIGRSGERPRRLEREIAPSVANRTDPLRRQAATSTLPLDDCR